MTLGITYLGDTGKRLREEALIPPRPSPTVPDPRTREEWGVQEAASLPAITRGQTRVKGPLPVWVLRGLHLQPLSRQAPWQPSPQAKVLEVLLATLVNTIGSQRSELFIL